MVSLEIRKHFFALLRAHKVADRLVGSDHFCIGAAGKGRQQNSEHASAREVEPLCLAFWGGAWTLGAWCRLRQDFRNFRPDRIASFDLTAETFVETAERGFGAYMRAMGGDADALDL